MQFLTLTNQDVPRLPPYAISCRITELPPEGVSLGLYDMELRKITSVFAQCLLPWLYLTLS